MHFKLLLITILIFLISCTKSEKKQEEILTPNDEYQYDYQYQIEPDEKGCVDFVALWSAEDISQKIGRDKKWVFLNYTVDIWDTPPAEGKGKPIGRLRASSYAQIIEYTQNDYLVESPITKVHGWVSNSHVKSITRKHPVTKKLCNE